MNTPGHACLVPSISEILHGRIADFGIRIGGTSVPSAAARAWRERRPRRRSLVRGGDIESDAADSDVVHGKPLLERPGGDRAGVELEGRERRPLIRPRSGG
jgi:hypothetical protein